MKTSRKKMLDRNVNKGTMVLVQKLVFKARDMAIDCYGNKKII
jgi:hypothetical protein